MENLDTKQNTDLNHGTLSLIRRVMGVAAMSTIEELEIIKNELPATISTHDTELMPISKIAVEVIDAAIACCDDSKLTTSLYQATNGYIDGLRERK